MPGKGKKFEKSNLRKIVDGDDLGSRRQGYQKLNKRRHEKVRRSREVGKRERIAKAASSYKRICPCQ
eukprot:763629-Pleurochrysis_carterae.AAC.2